MLRTKTNVKKKKQAHTHQKLELNKYKDTEEGRSYRLMRDLFATPQNEGNELLNAASHYYVAVTPNQSF